jgi:hypothetical protein
MTSLEEFLNNSKEEDKPAGQVEPASGSFSCQDLECKEVIFEGYVDRVSSRLYWVCSQGHKSSVII